MSKLALSRNGEESFKKILDPDGDPDHHQNLIDSQLTHFWPILKIILKSVHNFLRYAVDRQTNAQMHKQRMNT